MRAGLARFYGWKDSYIGSMPNEKALDYYKVIKVLDAQERLVEMQVAISPQMKLEDRKKFRRSLEKLASPKELQKEHTFEEFAIKTGMIDG
jgi:hypothetical protein